MTITNNSVKQINAALLGIRSSKQPDEVQEALIQQQQEEENSDQKIIDAATSQFNAGYYLADYISSNTNYNTTCTWPSSPVVRQNYFIFGEFMCIWGTFSAAQNTKTATVNSVSPERFITDPVVVITSDKGQASTWAGNNIGKVTYNNGSISFQGDTQFSWCLLGKVSI